MYFEPLDVSDNKTIDLSNGQTLILILMIIHPENIVS